jgi:hypothetical protein
LRDGPRADELEAPRGQVGAGGYEVRGGGEEEIEAFFGMDAADKADGERGGREARGPVL